MQTSRRRPPRRLIADLVRDAPAKVQVMIAARDSAALPLARLRTAGALYVTDVADLLLDEHDCAELGEGLSERQLQYVRAASGGWPVAAAGLAAGSRGSGRPGRSYQDCGLFEYIAQEVVTSLTADEEKVLTACALLSPITAVASARITSLAQAPEHLARSARKLPGLVCRVDGPDAGYRLNPVLQAFFVARLLSAEPAVSSRAVEQSCAELTLQGRVAEAVRIAQEAHRSDLAVCIIQDQDAIVWWLTVGPGATYLMAPFTHVSGDRPSRFSDGSYGVLYLAERFETALLETMHHHARFMAQTREAPGWTSQFRELILDLDVELHDLRDGSPVLAPALDRDSYGASQALGAALRSSGSNGVVYPSARNPDGECAGLFYPDCARPPVQGRHLDYHWNGARVDLYRDASNGELFRVG